LRFRTQVGQPNAQRGRPIRSQKRLLRVRSPIRATGRSPGTRRAGSQRTGKMAGKGIFFRFAKRALPASELRCCQAAEFARISSPSFFCRSLQPKCVIKLLAILLPSRTSTLCERSDPSRRLLRFPAALPLAVPDGSFTVTATSLERGVLNTRLMERGGN